MSTRGCIAVKKGDSWAGVYNHYDSYPTGLGNEVIKHLNQLKKEDKLKNFAEELLKYDDWRNYLAGGLCPYCGKKGLSQPTCLTGKVMTHDSHKFHKVTRAGFVKNKDEYIRKHVEGYKWSEKDALKAYKNELKVFDNVKKFGCPDPLCQDHKHEALDDSNRLMTPDSSDALFIEWVYVIDTDTEKIDVLAHTDTGEQHTESGRRSDGTSYEYVSPNYTWYKVGTLNLSSKAKDLKKLEKIDEERYNDDEVREMNEAMVL